MRFKIAQFLAKIQELKDFGQYQNLPNNDFFLSFSCNVIG